MTVKIAEQFTWSMIVEVKEQWNTETQVYDSEDDRAVELRSIGP